MAISKRLQLTNRDRKILSAICALILVTCSLTALVFYNLGVGAQGASALTMQTNAGGIYSGAPSYTVWNDSTTVYAKNAYGAIQSSWSSSTNALTTIQYAVSALTNGGSIYLKAGTYSIGTSALVSGQTFMQGISVGNAAITIYGEGDASILRLSVGNSRIISVVYGANNIQLYSLRFDGSNLNIHDGATADALIAVEGANGIIQGCTFVNGAGADGFGTYNTAGWRISDCNIGSCQHGIAFVESSRNLAEGNLISDNEGVGIVVAGGADGGSYSNTIRDNVVYGSGQDGIQISKSTNSGFWTIIEGCHVYNNAWSGLQIYSSSYTSVSNCQFYNNSGSGIFIDDDGITGSGNNKFMGVDSFTVTEGIQDCGLNESMNSFNTIIIGGYYWNNSVAGILLTNGNSKANLCWNGSTWLT